MEAGRFDIQLMVILDNPPRIHAIYQEQEVVVTLDGNILEGDLPSKKLRMLLVWIELRQRELAENWSLLSAGKRFFKVEPLR